MKTKTIVVVGASRGIGKELVLQFASDTDARIYALSRNREAMDRDFGHLPNVHTFAIDLASDTVRDELYGVLGEIGRIDVLVNNAGLLINKPFTQLSHSDLQQSYQVNVIGVMETVQALLPQLAKGSHVVNISSMGGFQGSMKFAGLAAYSTSKAALCSFTELFAEEYKTSGIHMNCLCLGAVQTEMLQAAFPGYEAPVSAEKMAAFIVDFALRSHQWMNGKIIPVSLSNP